MKFFRRGQDLYLVSVRLGYHFVPSRKKGAVRSFVQRTQCGKMAFESRKLGFVSLEAEDVSTQENLPCVSLPLLTMCVSFLLSAGYALHLLLTLTHLLSKGNGCVPGFQSAMEKDGMQRSLASSRNPLLQTNSKSQREGFLKRERHTDRRSQVS